MSRRYAIVDLSLNPPQVVQFDTIEDSDALHDGPNMMSVPIPLESPVQMGWVWRETDLFDPNAE